MKLSLVESTLAILLVISTVSGQAPLDQPCDGASTTKSGDGFWSFYETSTLLDQMLGADDKYVPQPSNVGAENILKCADKCHSDADCNDFLFEKIDDHSGDCWLMKKGTLNFPYTGPKDEPFKGIGGRGNCEDAYPQKWLQGTPDEPSKFKCCNIWY